MMRRGVPSDVIALIIENQTCQLCQQQAWGTKYGKPSWFVHDKVWQAAGLQPEDVVCQHCLSVRLRSLFELNDNEPAARQVHDILLSTA
jgi:hypothetical protein